MKLASIMVETSVGPWLAVNKTDRPVRDAAATYGTGKTKVLLTPWHLTTFDLP